ncbi:MAG TPA: hypothetical protein VHP83_25665 [Aggregatilineaceae bacterium]|nr:hypothetical protein [Aggregatilineaceae bacterium]
MSGRLKTFVIEDRDAATCDGCGKSSPAYRLCPTYTDFCKAYQSVLPKRTHHPLGKETGQMAHQERW